MTEGRYVKNRVMAVAVALLCGVLLSAAGTARGTEEYVEPVTGVCVSYPDFFSSSETDLTGQYGKIHVMINGSIGSSNGNLSVSVKEIGAKSIFDVLNKLVFDLDNSFRKIWTIHAVNRRYIEVWEEEESFGNKEYAFHRGWLLGDGSFLHVQINLFGEGYRRIADEVEVDIAPLVDRLMYDVGYASEDENALSGGWAKGEGPPELEIYGDRLLAFLDPSGNCRAYGLYDSFMGSLKLAVAGSPLGRRAYFAVPAEDRLKIDAFEDDMDGMEEYVYGEYVRVEKPSAPAAAPEGDDEYRGEWVNDSNLSLLSINRASIVLRTPNSQRILGYEETADGLRFSGDDGDALVRKTADGGLTMDGETGVFYRKGSEKAGGFTAKMAPYVGEWHNRESGENLKIQADGYLRWGESVGGYSPGTPDLDDQGRLLLLKRVGVIDDDGRLRIDELGVFDRVGEAAAAPAESGDHVAAIYEHGDFGGQEQRLAAGRYDLDDIELGNDILSSVKVAEGYRVILFRHAGFDGDSKVFESDASYVGDDFNDEVSSLIVEKK